MSSRASTAQGALGVDEADFHQDLECTLTALPDPQGKLSAEGLAKAQISDSSVAPKFPPPVMFVSILLIHEKLKHDFSVHSMPFREANPWVAPYTKIGDDQRPFYPRHPPVSILGTAILPLEVILRLAKKPARRLSLLVAETEGRPQPLTVGPDGTLSLMQRLRVFPHEVRLGFSPLRETRKSFRS